MTDADVRLSVVIPARNAGEWLADQLEALATQDCPFRWEVILADNGSTDTTIEVFNRISPRLPTAQIIDASATRGQAFARNQGADSARGEILVFVDADDVIAPGYLSAVESGMARCDVGVAQLDTRTLNPGRRGLDVLADGTPVAYLGFLPAGAGAGLAVRRRLFADLGGFDVDMPPAEDIDLCWRAQLAGSRLAPLPGAIVRYRLRTTTRRVFTQSYQYAKIRPALFRRYRSKGMPRRSMSEAVRFHLGVLPRVARIRHKDDFEDVTILVATRLGHLAGSIKYRTWYP